MAALLIVDDHKHHVESLMTTIPWDEHGITEVYGAHSGFEALEVLLVRDIHILLTDIQMPGMTGLELIERVRGAWPQVDCVLLTGYSEFQYAKRAIELQAVSYLLKPVRDEELLPLVDRLLAKRRERLEEAARVEALEQDIEASVLEERRRLARDLHDVLGHTLTATIVQLEAARRLLAHGRDEGLERLEETQRLVRQSLADFRETVKDIHREEPEGDLVASLEAFMQEVESSIPVEISRTIRLSEPVTRPEWIKALVLALREGLTNGIRHSQAGRFEFVLEQVEEVLCFRLWNSGISYAGGPAGFGLSAMAERIRRLGGAVSLEADGDRGGSTLFIRIPREAGQ